MLTKNLIRYRVYKGSVRPKFLKPKDEDTLQVATALIGLFEDHVGQAREVLDEAVDQLVQVIPIEPMIARGFYKLLSDRAVFEDPGEGEISEFRHDLFIHGGKLLTGDDVLSPEDYYQRLNDHFGRPIARVRELLYGDLPARHPLKKFKTLNPLQLVHLYNTSTVQWLLLSADKLIVTLADASTASQRQLYKYLRFHQLLADIESVGEESCRLVIDGPMNLFYQSKRYGMQLANFFPALLHQKSWKIEAELKLRKNKTFSFELDQDCGIQPIREHFHAFIPKEIRDMVDNFQDKVAGWRMETSQSFLSLPGDMSCFPDFRLIHEDGREVFLELFHPWHNRPLRSRLEQLHRQKKVPLLLGVARPLLRNPDLKAFCEAQAYFQEWSFLFNDLPPIKSLASLLKRLPS